MKKIVFTLTLGILSFTAFSQTNFRFGFTTSPGFSWYSVDSKFQKSDGAKFTFNYGAILDLNIGSDERYAISTGLDINMEGGKLVGFSDEEKTYKSSLVAKVQYLEIPIAIKLRSNESAQNLTYYGSLGIVNGFRIRARGKYKFDDGLTSVDEKNIRLKDLPFYDTKNDKIKKINVYQLALHFEAGVEYRVSDNTSVIGGLYFRNGFSNIIKDSDSDRVVSRGIGIRLGVMF